MVSLFFFSPVSCVLCSCSSRQLCGREGVIPKALMVWFVCIVCIARRETRDAEAAEAAEAAVPVFEPNPNRSAWKSTPSQSHPIVIDSTLLLLLLLLLRLLLLLLRIHAVTHAMSANLSDPAIAHACDLISDPSDATTW